MTYIVCRLGTLSMLFLETVFVTAPLNEYCSTIGKLLFNGNPILYTSSSFLLFLCARAFYLGNKRIVYAFMASFFVATAASILMPFLGVGSKATTPRSPYCTVTNKNTRFAQILISAELVNRSIIFFAIAIKLMPPKDERNPVVAQAKILALRRMLRGDHLPELSRALWWYGQRYIMVFIVTSSISFAAFSIGDFPDIYGFALVAPHIAIQNCMICYMIRSVRAAALNPNRNMDLIASDLVIT
ncbi:hypothetical protein VNI00_013537 [Paramarasmius palmivorus]|uniref:G protein-coupled receptor n=1 Tax=Paramarasmius palmivorus TaxID=297713 RepID=A0AAW0BWB7_9AGAR